MTPTNYDKHFKVLGKLCRIHDVGGGDISALQLLESRLFDQVATGESASLDAVLLMAGFANGLHSAVTATTQNVRSTVKTIAGAYLTAALFRNDLTTVPSDPTSPASVLGALRTDMGAGVDNKKLTNETTSGFVNFFKNVMGAGGTWNTAADASADYKDSVYVVDAIVA